MELIFPDSPGQWVALILLSILTLLIIPLGGGGSGGCHRAPKPKGPKPDILPPGYGGANQVNQRLERGERRKMNKVVAQIELPEVDELQKAIDEYVALTKSLEENAMKIRNLQLTINLKLKENQ